MSDQRPPIRPAMTILLLFALLSFVGHMLVAGNYGYFRDELYYLADGHHLQAGYVDQPAMMGWLAVLLRVTVGNGLVAIHILPALAAAAIVVVAGLLAFELGGGPAAQVVAAAAALFAPDFMGAGSIFSMDVLDQLWWSLATLVLARILRRNEPREWILFGVIAALGLFTKLTILFFGLAVLLALIVTPDRRMLHTRWPWIAFGIALVGLLPDIVWNLLHGWPTLDFYRHYGYLKTGPLAFFLNQIVLMNPIAFPLAAIGLVFYFRRPGARFRLLGWVFVFAYLVLTLVRGKPYFLAPAYPILFAAGGVAVERMTHGSRAQWVRSAYLGLLALAGLLLAPLAMPILSPATFARIYRPQAHIADSAVGQGAAGIFPQPLGDRFGWESLTRTVERVYAALPPAEKEQACVLASNYGEASALALLAPPGALPPVVSGHNNYFLWGPGSCSGKVLIVITHSPGEIAPARTYFRHVAEGGEERCGYCMPSENDLPIYVLADPKDEGFSLARVWPLLKHYD